MKHWEVSIPSQSSLTLEGMQQRNEQIFPFPQPKSSLNGCGFGTSILEPFNLSQSEAHFFFARGHTFPRTRDTGFWFTQSLSQPTEARILAKTFPSPSPACDRGSVSALAPAIKPSRGS